jgi:hypothetical protein
MRESRTSGSARGAGSNPRPYRDRNPRLGSLRERSSISALTNQERVPSRSRHPERQLEALMLRGKHKEDEHHDQQQRRATRRPHNGNIPYGQGWA